jgi:hypothetical protein
VRRTYRHKVVRLKQAQGCAKQLTGTCCSQTLLLFTLCLFELMAKSPSRGAKTLKIKGTHICSPTVSGTTAVLLRFAPIQKMGT